MKTERIKLDTFVNRDDFYPRLELLLTVKSFDLQAIRQRYIASKQNKSGKAGSVERRKVSEGGLVYVAIEGGKIVEERVLATLAEPRGIQVQGDLLGISSENTIYLATPQGTRSMTHPWFSYIHTLDFNPDRTRFVVASSGLDCLFEFDLHTLEVTWEWFGWENGFQIAHDPATNSEIRLTRKPAEAAEFARQEIHHLLISDPQAQVLPTAKRAAFINSVCYDTENPGQLLATFFHEGAVYAIDMASGEARKVLGGLKTPHGGRNLQGKFFATSTGSGEVVIGNPAEEIRYDFAGLAGKPAELGELEWLQNSVQMGENFITIDSNRTSLVIFNPRQQIYSRIPYNHDWAVQDIVQQEGITQLVNGPLMSSLLEKVKK
ncbi:MAG: hypothetical protein H6581_07150 [Bacteroidia bacterium]|nr:hypothetical protein [Bacteroidia bacterium]